MEMRKRPASEGKLNDQGDQGQLLQLMRGLAGLEESQTELRKDIAIGTKARKVSEDRFVCWTRIRICLSQLWGDAHGCTWIC